MARFPGTETATNLAGWAPGDTVRCRRSRANAARELMDRRGFLAEVRAHHVRLVLDGGRRSVWLESDAVVAEPDLRDADLALLREVFGVLRGQRLQIEGDEVVVFGEAFPAHAVDEVRALLGERLVEFELAPHGVHELASHIRLAATD